MESTCASLFLTLSRKKLSMPDQIIKERLEGITEHIAVLQYRMESITNPDSFKTEAGQIIFDSILMRLQSIGENIKKIEDLQPGFCDDELHIEVGNIIRFRDLISHHYEQMDIQIVFDIVQNHIPPLKESILNYSN
jgi:uncharacterized protein with HEPN domain